MSLFGANLPVLNATCSTGPRLSVGQSYDHTISFRVRWHVISMSRSILKELWRLPMLDVCPFAFKFHPHHQEQPFQIPTINPTGV